LRAQVEPEQERGEEDRDEAVNSTGGDSALQGTGGGCAVNGPDAYVRILSIMICSSWNLI
jgi:hypothetical protein